MAQVDPARPPASPAPPVRPVATPPPTRPAPGPYRGQAPAKRSSLGYWLAGCGCLAVLAIVVVVGALFVALGRPSGGGPAAPTADDQTVQGQVAVYETELAAYHALAAQLAGNPVASLVTRTVRVNQLMDRVADTPNPNYAQAENFANTARQHREELEQRIADAASRRENASGTEAERLVDEAGQGFIDIHWDAATACASGDEPGTTTVGCVSEDPIAVHLRAASEIGGGPEAVRMVVLHELTHLYQRADLDNHLMGDSDASRLLDQGLFQGSSEKMADCYALTYLGLWSLTIGDFTYGYGYVCGDAERQAIRAWATELGAPVAG